MGEAVGGESDEQIRDAITLAKNMWNNGAPPEVIESRLVRRGFDKPAVEAVLRHIPKEKPNNIIVGKNSTGGRTVLVIVGLIISGFGFLFAVGNRSGLIPTLPYLGFAIKIIGGVIMAAARS